MGRHIARAAHEAAVWMERLPMLHDRGVQVPCSRCACTLLAQVPCTQCKRRIGQALRTTSHALCAGTWQTLRKHLAGNCQHLTAACRHQYGVSQHARGGGAAQFHQLCLPALPLYYLCVILLWHFPPYCELMLLGIPHHRELATYCAGLELRGTGAQWCCRVGVLQGGVPL